ncbi:MAG TPA: sulfotransferase, partial [Alphaproteobacteria bacterium]|nr:sulfotransferase [Alphaproteobacteria bacterium]
IKMDPQYATPYYYLNDLKKYTAADEDFAQLQRLANSTALPPTQKTMIQYALGKAYMDIGDVESAFRHYTLGNKMRKDGAPKYDMDTHKKYIDQIIKAFDETVVARLAGKTPAVPAAPQPVFIVGMPRSGSTLVDQIIASHPDAVSLGEVPYVNRAMPVVANAALPASFVGSGPSISAEMLATLTPDILHDFAKKYLAQSTLETTCKKYIVDKMLQNFIWTGILLLAFPQAKVLHTRRDPVDTGLSIWTLMFTDGTYWSYDQKDIARYHLACDRLMAHWKKIFPGRILDVVYEDMIADQEGQSRRVLDFCNIPWDGRCLRFYETKRTVKTSSVEQVRRPIYTSSVKKWKKYESYLGDMIEALEAGGYRLRG